MEYRRDSEEKDAIHEEEYSFLQETIKDNRREKRARIIRTAGLGLVFGLAASLGFFALKPFVERATLGTPDEVNIEMDEEIPEEEPVEVSEEDLKEVALEVSMENYREMNKALKEIGDVVQKSMVTLSITEEVEEGDPKETTISGVIVADNGMEYLVFATDTVIADDSEITATFVNNKSYKAEVKAVDENIGFAVYAVSKSKLSQNTKDSITVATLGNSKNVEAGNTAIVVGSPFGYSNAMGFGAISTEDKLKRTLTDGAYSLLGTDISTVAGGTGVVVDIHGKVIGIIDQRMADSDTAPITAYGISDLKKVIEILANGENVPYIGIVGIGVNETMSEEQGLPTGVYIHEVKPDSPAMEAAIQSGDIITSIDGTEITSLDDYHKELMNLKVGETVTVKGMRQGKNNYEKIEYSVKIGVCK